MCPKTPSTVTLILFVMALVVNSDTTTSKSNAKLEIRSDSSLPYAAVGNSVILDCVLLVNNERVEEVDVIWLDPAEKAIRETPFWKTFRKESSILTIKILGSSYDGNFTCKIDNDEHKLSATVEIIPVTGVEFSNLCEAVQLLTADNDDRGTISCNVVLRIPNGYAYVHRWTRIHSSDVSDHDVTNSSTTATAPTLSDVQILWYKNGVPYVPPSGRCHVNNSIGIVCDQVVEDDAGNYSIVARMTSLVEQIINRTIVVGVLTFPHIQNLPTEVVAVENSTVKLTCRATGNPPPTYIWYNDDCHAANKSLRRFRYDTKSGQLIIRDVGRHEAGLISCFAENDVGGDLRKVKLVVTTVEAASLVEHTGTIFSSQNWLNLEDFSLCNVSLTAASSDFSCDC